MTFTLRLGRLWKEFLEPVAFAVVVTQFAATLVGVDGASMMPNLRDHERVFVPKYETWLHKAGIGQFQRGDIVIFKPPREVAARAPELTRPGPLGLWTYRPFLIKRLIALPGDTVRVTGGQVSVNGQEVAQGFTTDYWREQGCWDTGSDLANHAQSPGLVRGAQEFRVPPGQYFVMGDNRTAQGSEDSRTFGPVPLRDIAGRAAAVVWPIMRKTNARYDCAEISRPQDHVVFSGESVPNLRMLSRPEGFQSVR
ncbi:signal peptidase I [Deinococcus humi]|uniref:Signal peptidase I n=1 Tax=Deinococcus humi TaxID=662880 RepID=A0A7W8JXA2_9DEIO|nr:signal peptidase I [Deinococcus humi]GGO30013.1 signal peptidase I [Deinococcus humi]